MYDYKVVPDQWRVTRVPRKKTKRNTTPSIDPVIQLIEEGKTVLLDANISIEDKERPYKNLYNYFNSRGKRLRMYVVDEVDLGIFRGLLMWAEPFIRVVRCRHCRKIETTSIDTLPSRKGCLNDRWNHHLWKEIIVVDDEAVA